MTVMSNVTFENVEKTLLFETVLGETWLLTSLISSPHGPCQEEQLRLDSSLLPTKEWQLSLISGYSVIQPHWL